MPSPAQASGTAGGQALKGVLANAAVTGAANGRTSARVDGKSEEDEPTATGAAAGTAAGVAEPTPAGQVRRGELPDWALAAITAVLTLPILWMGYGTDVDI